MTSFAEGSDRCSTCPLPNYKSFGINPVIFISLYYKVPVITLWLFSFSYSKLFLQNVVLTHLNWMLVPAFGSNVRELRIDGGRGGGGWGGRISRQIFNRLQNVLFWTEKHWIHLEFNFVVRNVLESVSCAVSDTCYIYIIYYKSRSNVRSHN